MAHNFRKTSLDGYQSIMFYSKAGGMAGANGTADLPYSDTQPMDINFRKNVLGTGFYRYSAFEGNSYNAGLVVADGIVVMEPSLSGTWAGQLSIARSGVASFNFQGIRMQNYNRVLIRTYDNTNADAGLNFYGGELEMNNTPDNLRAEPFNASKPNVRHIVRFTDHICYTINQADGYYARISATRSIFRNCTALYIAGASYSYFDQSATLYLIGGAAQVTNCNIRGKVVINGVTYNTVAEAIANGGLPASNFSAEPGFNNEFTRDYTLKLDSIHLSRGIGPAHLRLSNSLVLMGEPGPVTADSGHYFVQLSTNSVVPILSAENITAALQQGQLRMQVTEAVGGAFVGKFRTAPIRVGDVPQTITGIRFAAGLNFDTDNPPLESQFDANNPQPLNNNVPNSHNYASGHAGRNPNRTEVPMRWSTKDSPRDEVPTDWVTGENFALFEWNETALYNPVTGYGNGSPEFLPAGATTTENTPKNPIATFVQFEVVLMNNYYSK